MNLEKQDFNSEVVDGQLLLVPHQNLSSSLSALTTIDHMPLGVPKSFKKMVRIMQPYQEQFIVGLHTVGVPPRAWLHLVLLKTQTGWQRVHLEWLTCESCKWYGMTANPTIPDLYYGLPNWRAVYQAGTKHPVLPCPCCKGTLPRHPIWTEPCSIRTKGHTYIPQAIT